MRAARSCLANTGNRCRSSVAAVGRHSLRSFVAASHVSDLRLAQTNAARLPFDQKKHLAR